MKMLYHFRMWRRDPERKRQEGLISVVIPTHLPRYPLTRKVLQALHVQEDPGPFEVLVCTDGPVPSWSREFPFARWLEVNDPTPAAKRNRGMEEAQGNLILFLDDDVIPERGVLRAHRQGHTQFPDRNVVLIGEVIWPPEVRQTALGFWVEWGHAYLDYRRWKAGQTVPSYAFYAGHLSGKRSYLLNTRFDPGYRALAYEDADFGFRLPGLRIVFWPQARALHDKVLTWEDMVRRARAMGTMRPYFLARNPHRKRRVESLLKRGAFVFRNLKHLDAFAERLARHPRFLGLVYAPLFTLATLGHFVDALMRSPFAPDAVYPSLSQQEGPTPSVTHAKG